jgi:hypothetical protein
MVFSLTINNTLIYRHVRGMYRQTFNNNPKNAPTVGGTRDATASMTGAMDGGETQTKRTRQVATQCTLFMIAALLDYTPFLILRLLTSFGFDKDDQTKFFGITVMQAIFTPIAGFLNAVIFLRP